MMMMKARPVEKNSMARLEYVPRRLSALAHKIRPVDNKQQISPTTNTNTFLDSIPSISLKDSTRNQVSIQNQDEQDFKTRSQSVLSPTFSTDNKKQIKDSKDGSSNWFSRLTSKQQFAFKLIIAVLILLSISAAVVLPVYFFVIRQDLSQSSFTNFTASICSTSTCIGKETAYRTSIITTLYAFDGNANDQSGFASGILNGGASPSGLGYVSQGLTLASASAQYVQIPTINFAKQSFTIQTWIYPTSPTTATEYGLFGQCDSNMICLLLSIRNARIAFTFDSMNTTNSSNTLIGSSLMTVTWIHITAVYDATLFQQRIYVNGRIDALSSGIVSAYQGSSTISTTSYIGRSVSSAYSITYFNGRIDHFTVSLGTVRNACQILNDASLVVYYPFDTTSTFNDYSVNVCNGIGLSTTIVSKGRVGQAISFAANISYFQSLCFPRMRNDLSYTFSLWINPSSTTGGGTLIHLSTNTGGNGTCYDVLAFTGTGNLVMQWMTGAALVVNVQGPVISANTWTHIAVVYLSSNAIRLYINGQFSVSSLHTASVNLYDTSSGIYPMFITLGNIGSQGPVGSVTCGNGGGSILPGSFTGYIDEFRLYNRDLDNQELCILANP